MALTFQEAFNGPGGTSLSTSNTGFSNVTANPAVFSTAIKKAGTASARFQTTGSFSYAERTFSATSTRYWSFYLRPAATPSANTVVFHAGTSNAGADRRFQITLNTDRTVKVQQGQAAIIVGSNTASSLPLNEWSRIDVSFDNGSVVMSVYPGDTNCDNPVDSATTGDKITGTISSAAISYLYLGVGNSTTNDIYIDEFREDDAGVPGAVGAGSVEPYLFYDNGTEWVDVTESLYYDNGTTWVRVEESVTSD